jgi:predicted MPP superfamily phosphohydrolase
MEDAMSLALLQISDIHIGNTIGDRFIENVSKISAAIRPRCRDTGSLLVVISGDIAFSGKNAEFVVANEFLDSLMDKLKKELPLKVLGPVIVPGNHDCDFSVEGSIRPLILRALLDNPSSVEVVEDQVQEVCKVQDAFFSFEERYSGKPKNGSKRLYYSTQYETDDGKILVHSFNTAWVSALPEGQGKLVFPKIKMDSAEERPLLAISVFHHPYEWFDPVNRRQFTKLVERHSDIALTGHEHEGDHFERKSSDGTRVTYIEGMPFSTKGADTGFNLVLISTSEGLSRVVKFAESGSMYVPNSDIEVPFLRNPHFVTITCENNASFEDELTRCPVSFSNSKKEGLRIADVFVYPDLKVTNWLDKNSVEIKSEQVLSYIVENNWVHIVGDAMCGKTTVSQKLYIDLRDQFQYIPILLRGEDISSNPHALDKAVWRAFSSQYSDENREQFRQLPAKRKALIIDDWHRSNLNSKGVVEFLRLAQQEFGTIATFGAKRSWLEDMLEAATHNEESEFKHCEIREFGHRLREQILFKWHSLGQEYELEKAQIIRNVASSGSQLNAILGKGFFPSYPFFMLYALQILSVEQSDMRIHGSYGHIYEAFITKRLSAIVQKPTQIGAYYTYLSQFAYEMFSQNKKSLTAADVQKVHDSFVKKYDIPWLLENTLPKLESTGIFAETPDGYSFGQRYCYFLFVAKYFQKSLGNDPNDTQVLAHLKELTEMVHDDEYMNVVIFYIYLTEDRRLIETLLTNARAIFAEYQPCELRDDVAFLSSQMERRKLSLDQSDVEKNRNDFAAQQDDAEARLETMRQNYNRTKYDRTLRLSVKLDFAYHCLEVMGQMLRNFPGDIKADLKIEITREAYQLALRTIGAVLQVLRENSDLIRSVLEQLVLIHRAKHDPEENEQEALKVFIRLAEASIFGNIKRLSTAVGTEDLDLTYSAVKEMMDEQNNAVQLIDLSIRLDHYAKLPHPEIDELALSLRPHVVAFNVFIMLLAEHLHLFEVTYKDRQKLSRHLGTNIQNLILSDKMFKLN